MRVGSRGATRETEKGRGVSFFRLRNDICETWRLRVQKPTERIEPGSGGGERGRQEVINLPWAKRDISRVK